MRPGKQPFFLFLRETKPKEFILFVFLFYFFLNIYHAAAPTKYCLKVFSWIWDRTEFQNGLGDKPVLRKTMSVSVAQKCDSKPVDALCQGKLHCWEALCTCTASPRPCSLCKLSSATEVEDRVEKLLKRTPRVVPGRLTVLKPCNKDEKWWGNSVWPD